MTTPYGRISNEPGERERERERERKKEREQNAIYSGQLRLCQQPRAAHALRSDQNSPPDAGETMRTMNKLIN